MWDPDILREEGLLTGFSIFELGLLFPKGMMKLVQSGRKISEENQLQSLNSTGPLR